MTEIEKALLQLNNLSDELIENIMETSDEDILQEVEEEYGNPLYEADKARDSIIKIQMDIARKRFNSAREELNAFNNKSHSFERNTSDLSQLSELETLAARDGKEIPETDKTGILEDLEDLKNMGKK